MPMRKSSPRAKEEPAPHPRNQPKKIPRSRIVLLQRKKRAVIFPGAGFFRGDLRSWLFFWQLFSGRPSTIMPRSHPGIGPIRSGQTASRAAQLISTGESGSIRRSRLLNPLAPRLFRPWLLRQIHLNDQRNNRSPPPRQSPGRQLPGKRKSLPRSPPANLRKPKATPSR